MSSLVFETLDGLRSGAASEYVFSKPGKRPLHDVRGSFKAACDDAEIKGVRIHDLRHTALWRMVKAGADLVTVSKIAGHSSIQMTMRYCHPMEEDMRLAVERLGEIIAGSRQKVDMVSIPKPAKDLKRYL
jgi:integrase